MNHNHPKELRLKRQEAKKSAYEFKKILKRMDEFMNSSSEHYVEVASAFYQILYHHIEVGDLAAHNVNLAAYLREKNE